MNKHFIISTIIVILIITGLIGGVYQLNKQHQKQNDPYQLGDISIHIEQEEILNQFRFTMSKETYNKFKQVFDFPYDSVKIDDKMELNHIKISIKQDNAAFKNISY